jgi:hypothetical protein
VLLTDRVLIVDAAEGWVAATELAEAAGLAADCGEATDPPAEDTRLLAFGGEGAEDLALDFLDPPLRTGGLAVLSWAPTELDTTTAPPGSLTDGDDAEPDVPVVVAWSPEPAAELWDVPVAAGVSAVAPGFASPAAPVDAVDPPSGSAQAVPGMAATAAPTPRATANAPTRPT